MWTPLGSASWRATVSSAVADIAEVLATHVPVCDVARANVGELALFDGRTGLALFHGGYARARADDRHAELAQARFDEVATALAGLPLEPSLYSGYTGIAWVASQLTDDALDEDIGPALLADVRGDRDHDFDLVWGITGAGLYALERGQTAAVGAVVESLLSSARTLPDGVAWWRPASQLTAGQRRVFSDGLYDVGLAHGTAGVIVFLARALDRAPTDRARVCGVIEQAARWLWNQRRDGRYMFPAMVGADGQCTASRFGWCYGDLGVALALLAAGGALDDATLVERGLAVARVAAATPLGDSSVVDPSVCHGAAGVGHLLHRLFRATGESAFADAAIAWLSRCLAMRSPDLALAGWCAPPPPGRWSERFGLMTGIAGVGLALLAAISDVEPTWDRVLLV
jgi:class I lanthipeptide synthase